MVSMYSRTLSGFEYSDRAFSGDVNHVGVRQSRQDQHRSHIGSLGYSESLPVNL